MQLKRKPRTEVYTRYDGVVMLIRRPHAVEYFYETKKQQVIWAHEFESIIARELPKLFKETCPTGGPRWIKVGYL